MPVSIGKPAFAETPAASDKKRLRNLLAAAGWNRGAFLPVSSGDRVGIGTKPSHYKRLTLTLDEADRYAAYGAAEIYAAFGNRLYYTQALIAGVILSGDFDTVGIVCPSQYGKSFLMGRCALLMAHKGRSVNIAAAGGEKTEIIMRYCQQAASCSMEDIKQALTGETLRKVDRLDQSLSKTRLSFARGGFVQGLSLGDSYSDLSRNQAVGRGGSYMIDEAALVSDRALAEVGRREFSTTDGSREPLIMISNPHRSGWFYDFLTQETTEPGDCVIWTDALTACQEGRWEAEQVLKSKFAANGDTLKRYLLCELPDEGTGMFQAPVIRPYTEDETVGSPYTTRVLGIDAAYKGKDNIEVCLGEIEADTSTPSGKTVMYFKAIETIRKPEWIDGVTSQDIIRQIAKIYHSLDCVACCVDIGYGVWLLEGLIQHGVNARGVNFGAGATRERIKAHRYAAVEAKNLRAEMHLDLADLMEHQACEFSEQAYKRIQNVLPLVTSRRTHSNKIQVISKQTIKAALGKSPDAFDALLLCLHAAVLCCEDDVPYMTA